LKRFCRLFSLKLFQTLTQKIFWRNF